MWLLENTYQNFHAFSKSVAWLIVASQVCEVCENILRNIPMFHISLTFHATLFRTTRQSRPRMKIKVVWVSLKGLRPLFCLPSAVATLTTDSSKSTVSDSGFQVPEDPAAGRDKNPAPSWSYLKWLARPLKRAPWNI